MYTKQAGAASKRATAESGTAGMYDKQAPQAGKAGRQVSQAHIAGRHDKHVREARV